MRRDQAEHRVRAGLAEGGAGEPLLLGLETEARLREQRALAGVDVLLRLAQRGLRRVEVGIGAQRLLDQAVERRRAEQRPPVAGNVALRNETLRRAAAGVDRGGLRGQRLRRVAGIRRRRRTVEIRTDRATADGQRDRDRAQARCSTHDHLLRGLRKIACMWSLTTDCADRTRASPMVSQCSTRLVPQPQKILAWPMIVIACNSTCSCCGGRSIRRPMMAQHGSHTCWTMSSCKASDRRVRFDLHAREEPLATFAIGHAVVEYQRDHDVEHVAQQADQSPARGLTARQLGAYALGDRRDPGANFLAELLDHRAIERPSLLPK